MAIMIKNITAAEFLEVTPGGIINITTSRQLLVEIAKAEHQPVDHELLIDFRDTRSNLTVSDMYQLAAELCQQGDTFRRRVALLVAPGVNFERARFFEICSHDRGFSVNAFTDYEEAMRWVLSTEEPTSSNVPSNTAAAHGVREPIRSENRGPGKND